MQDKKNINWAAKKYYDIKTSCFNLAITLILFVQASDNLIATFILYCELHTDVCVSLHSTYTYYYLLYIKFTLQMNPISVTAIEESLHEMRDKSYLCPVCGMGMKWAISIEDLP